MREGTKARGREERQGEGGRSREIMKKEAERRGRKRRREDKALWSPAGPVGALRVGAVPARGPRRLACRKV